jgi:hypothetical protein
MLSEDVGVYLKELNAEIKSGRKTNLWEFTLAHRVSGGSRETSVELIAVLFQSNRFKNMIDAINPRLANYGVLKESLSLLSPGNVPSNFSFYPAPVSVRIERPDHFFVIAYWAQRLRQSKFTEAEAFFSSYLANRFSELWTDTVFEKRAADIIKKDLENNVPAEDVSYLNDVYLGLVGALHGAGASPEIFNEAADIEHFVKKFYSVELPLVRKIISHE